MHRICKTPHRHLTPQILRRLHACAVVMYHSVKVNQFHRMHSPSLVLNSLQKGRRYLKELLHRIQNSRKRHRDSHVCILCVDSVHLCLNWFHSGLVSSHLLSFHFDFFLSKQEALRLLPRKILTIQTVFA